MEIKPTILVVDDELGARQSLEVILEEDYRMLSVESGKEALEILQREPVNLILLDVNMPDMDGLEVLRRIRAQDEEMDVIMVSALNLARKAVDAIRLGAYDYITKPYEPEDILSAVHRVINKQKLQRELDFLRREVQTVRGFDQIISQNKKMLEIFELIKKVAYTSTNILITGESGTGKELVARSIHRQGNRKSGPFVAINCAAIPSELMESEMFGHERGAFTGAHTRTIGKFEHANGGTLFLDEISTLRTDLQAKLLRVLQEREIERIGSNRPIKVDIRVIAATNTNLENVVTQGKFRQDLYFRLNVVPVSIPPLRERKEDIPLLAKHFLNKFNISFNKKIPGFSEKALDALSRYHWPGNIRELENLIERITVLFPGDDKIDLENIPIEILMSSGPGGGDFDKPQTGLIKLREEFEKRVMLNVLEATRWNQTEAAKILRMNRSFFIKKARDLGIFFKAV
ncbi:MAG: sigma-54-dependent Fis family transcriptional regulator [Deltaproteobacteria bacterium RBG_16_49_23]|nr:MAG: sigma-54-dependent Fis family transcriptional regulator [Deltaproteobacteria bacterium RBG_16_49_23]